MDPVCGKVPLFSSGIDDQMMKSFDRSERIPFAGKSRLSLSGCQDKRKYYQFLQSL